VVSALPSAAAMTAHNEPGSSPAPSVEDEYAAINRLAENPETVKDALILWLALRLTKAHRALCAIASVSVANTNPQPKRTVGT
jgi:hypothetical protein